MEDSETLRKMSVSTKERNPDTVPEKIHFVSASGDLGIVNETFDIGANIFRTTGRARVFSSFRIWLVALSPLPHDLGTLGVYCYAGKKFNGGNFLNDETINKIAAQSAELHFAEDLPAELEGFALKKIFAAHEDKYIFFTCTDDEIHCALTTYFHTETREFKVLQRIGLTEFCLTKFFTEDFAHFKQLIDSELRGALENLRGLRSKPLNMFLREKKLDKWKYGSELPQTLEGFELFISPAAPVEVTNGSFIIINYADFALKSDFVLDYNIYTDEFSGEAKICGAPKVTYKFDAKTLPELEDRLKKNLLDELKEIRRLSTVS